MLNTRFLLFGSVIVFLCPLLGQAQSPSWLIPKDVVVQHAGSIGYFSAGVGYHLLRNNRGSLDFSYGYVPEGKGGSLRIASAKFAYRPLEVDLGNWGKLFPLNPGAFISYHFGKEFDLYWDKDIYQEGYYWWSSAVRPHVSLSAELKLDGEKVLKAGKIKAITLYTEFNTNELYLVSLIQNVGGLPLADIIKLGFGIRFGF